MERLSCRGVVLPLNREDRRESLNDALNRLHKVMKRWDERFAAERPVRKDVYYVRLASLDQLHGHLTIDHLRRYGRRGDARAGGDNGMVFVLNVEVVQTA